MNKDNLQQTLTTEQLADLLHAKPNTIRSRLCKYDSYYGLKPIKLPSGRLLWSVEDVHKFLAGNAA